MHLRSFTLVEVERNIKSILVGGHGEYGVRYEIETTLVRYVETLGKDYIQRGRYDNKEKYLSSGRS